MVKNCKGRQKLWMLGFCFLLGLTSVQAQWMEFNYSNSIPVVGLNNQPKDMFWSGALCNPQFQEMDVNGDGLQDAIIYDRQDDKLCIWLKTPGTSGFQYKYAPEFESLFPAITNWFVLRDYNNDGLKDIYSSSNGNIMVYKNTGSVSRPSFTLMQNILYADFGTGFPINIYVMNLEVPGISDIDNDGDLDILSFDNFYLGQLNYYKCMSMERYGRPDSFEYTVPARCWGQFYQFQNSNGALLYLDQNCNPTPQSHRQSALARVQHSGASSALIDYDHDGDKDLLLGDISYPWMVFLKNGGTPQFAQMVAKDTLFPNYNTPVKNPNFAIPNLMDVDNDGDQDLIVSVGDTYGGGKVDNVQLYRNIRSGTTANDSFQLDNLHYLTERFIKGSQYAFPLSMDLDQDGDQDLLVSHHTGKGFSTLFAYKNTGTIQAPAFQLIDTNYLNLQALKLTFAYPASGDLNGDGKPDLVLGHQPGNIIYFQNISPAQASQLTFAAPDSAWRNITVSGYAAPEIADINRDGKLDIIVGDYYGRLSYYQNSGSATNPQFTLISNNWGQLQIAVFSSAFSRPRLSDLNKNGHLDLIVGSESGKLFLYPDVDSSTSAAFTSVSNVFWEPLRNQHVQRNHGWNSSPALFDINGDTYPDLIVGTQRGGLQSYLNTLTSVGIQNLSDTKESIWSVFPNPSNTGFTLQSAESHTGYQLLIYDIGGRSIEEINIPQGTQSFHFGDQLNPGFYLIQMVSKNGIRTVKRVVVR